MQKKEFNIKSNKPVVICVFSKEDLKSYIEILKKLREANISSEVYPGEGNLKKQMQYANKIGSPAVILYGEDEKKSGKPILKDLKSGEEINTEIMNLPNEIKKIL
jgi:histidyl-tRNA synthetase